MYRAKKAGLTDVEPNSDVFDNGVFPTSSMIISDAVPSDSLINNRKASVVTLDSEISTSSRGTGPSENSLRCYIEDKRTKIAKLSQILEEIESMLYEGVKPRHLTTEQECKEWIRHFIFLRIVGHGIPIKYTDTSSSGDKASRAKQRYKR